MGSGIFKKCYSLTDAILPSSISIFPDSFFQDCSLLKESKIPLSISFIGIGSFYKYSLFCIRFMSFINRNIKYHIQQFIVLHLICDNAFCDCSMLQRVIFETLSQLNSIHNYAFARCTSLL